MGGELSALPDATVEAVILAASRGFRGCEYAPGQYCGGTHTDCYYRGLLDAARDPALGQDRLVLSREFDEVRSIAERLSAGLVQRGIIPGRNPDGVNDDPEKVLGLLDEALAEVARLTEDTGTGGDER